MDILNEKIEGLVTKAEKSGMPYGILKKVYDRGMAAWKTGHRPGTTPQQWAFARVNSFITKSSGTWGKADADLAKKVRGEQVENRTKSAKDILGQIIKEAKFNIEFEKGEVEMVGMYDMADIVQDELQKKRIRAKVTYPPTSNFSKYSLEFNTSVPKKKIMKTLEDVYGYTVHESKEIVKEENCPKCDDDPCKCENITEKQGDNMNEAPRQLEDPKKETMVMKVKDANSIMVIDKKDLKKYTSKGYIQVESNEVNLEEGKMKELAGRIANVVMKMKKDRDMKGFADKFKKDVMKSMDIEKSLNKVLPDYIAGKDIAALVKEEVESNEEDLDEGKYTLPITHVIVDTRTNKVTHAANGDKSLKLDVGRKSHLKIVKLKKPTTQKKTGYLLGEPLKAWGEEVELDEKEINYDGKGPIKMSKKEYASINKFRKSMIRGKPYVMALNTKNQSTNLVPVIFEEVDDNSMMARATRLISQTAIKEKLDPADIDMKATDLDRKAADKNIFIQLKRAQDMKGKTDVEFLDKKKQKVDIKIINKALDMFDKMKPNDKLKMQLAIGKSYRDLLKVVQRGKV